MARNRMYKTGVHSSVLSSPKDDYFNLKDEVAGLILATTVFICELSDGKTQEVSTNPWMRVTERILTNLGQ